MLTQNKDTSPNTFAPISYGGKKKVINENRMSEDTSAMVLFVDMNSFFASCEQQVNYYLRGRPVGVCVYTSQNGCIIAPSIEAKKFGVKVGMRLPEAMQLCPELVPLETNPNRYRDFHTKIIAVLRKYSENVIPKSIDEAVVNLHTYKLIYKDVVEVAKNIKKDIKNEVGDWLKCSIGIAPNAFLAKLASDIQKPDGLTIITPENIDEVLSKLKLTDMPGIAEGMAARLNKGGIYTPLQLRHTSPDALQVICKSIVGVHWHYRLNFKEIDLATHDYKSMSAMRHISYEQRKSVETLHSILQALCMKLEERMVKRECFAKRLYCTIKYNTGNRWDDDVNLNFPIQDGIELLNIIKMRMKRFEQNHENQALINNFITSICIVINDFVPSNLVQYTLFDNNQRKDKLRKTIYEIKSKFGSDKLMKGNNIQGNQPLTDVIGFGSIKDLDDET